MSRDDRFYVVGTAIVVAGWLAIARVWAAADSSGSSGGRPTSEHPASVAVGQSHGSATRRPAKPKRPADRARANRTLTGPVLFWPADVNDVNDVNGADDSGNDTPAPLGLRADAPPESSSIQPLQPLRPPQPSPGLPKGSLLLDVNPRTAQVYVDGFYVGSIADSSIAGLTLASGWHRIQLRAQGYETLAVNVTVQANRSTDSHWDLKPIRP